MFSENISQKLKNLLGYQKKKKKEEEPKENIPGMLGND